MIVETPDREARFLYVFSQEQEGSLIPPGIRVGLVHLHII
jgi:hypothetical protein